MGFSWFQNFNLFLLACLWQHWFLHLLSLWIHWRYSGPIPHVHSVINFSILFPNWYIFKKQKHLQHSSMVLFLIFYNFCLLHDCVVQGSTFNCTSHGNQSDKSCMWTQVYITGIYFEMDILVRQLVDMSLFFFCEHQSKWGFKAEGGDGNHWNTKLKFSVRTCLSNAAKTNFFLTLSLEDGFAYHEEEFVIWHHVLSNRCCLACRFVSDFTDWQMLCIFWAMTKGLTHMPTLKHT